MFTQPMIWTSSPKIELLAGILGDDRAVTRRADHPEQPVDLAGLDLAESLQQVGRVPQSLKDTNTIRVQSGALTGPAPSPRSASTSDMNFGPRWR